MSRSYSRSTAVVPVFIPHGVSPAGGGAEMLKHSVLFLSPFLVFGVVGVYLAGRPRFQMKFVRSPGGGGYSVMLRKKNWPTKMVIQTNADGLKGKGYAVTLNGKKDCPYEYMEWANIANVETKKSEQEFLADCKSGDVHTIVQYSYDSWYLEKEVKSERKLLWHKQQVQEWK